MHITIVGGGNIGTQFAVHCAEKKHEVTVYTRPKKFQRHLLIVDHEGSIIHEEDIKTATSDVRTAYCDADVIFSYKARNYMPNCRTAWHRCAEYERHLSVVL